MALLQKKFLAEFNMIDWPEGLVSDLARRRAVVLIGAGVSRQSIGKNDVRPPLWREFLEKAISDCPDKSNLKPIQDALASGDLLHACEWLKQRFDEKWTSYLRQIFSQPAFAPAEIHNKILLLDSRIIFSLNFDDIYERNANSIHAGSYIVKNYHDSDATEFLRGSGNYIMKVHGSLHTAGQTIFTQKDYSRARVEHSAFYQAFDATLLTHTFLFIGSGYSDPDINLLLENQNFSFPAQSPHYFLSGTKLGPDRVKSLRDNRNIKILDYDAIDDNHSGLLTELDSLIEKVDAERFNLAASTNW